ncbi:MAG: 50S ribosomal protein L6 [Bacilli bacterium]
MSRIGKRPLAISDSTEVKITDENIEVKGKLGVLNVAIPNVITVKQEENNIIVERTKETKLARSLHGTINALIKNALVGVNEGYKKNLEIVGVGYRFADKAGKVGVSAGFSHPVELEIPEGLKVEYVSNTEISISGIDKELLGQFCAVIRGKCPVEPYKGKGIRYKGEHVRRKEAKKGGK